MPFAQMRAFKKSDFKTDWSRDHQIIMKKTREELAESIEIMMVELRPVNYARVALRGAICMMRLEPTIVPKDHAIHALTKLKDRWDELEWDTRSLIVKRAIDMIHTGSPERIN